MIRRHWLKFLLLNVLIVIAFLLIYFFREHFQYAELKTWIMSHGVWAPVVFGLVYTVAVVFLLPASVLTIVGGLLFGPWWGTLINLISATLGAGIAFFTSRYIASNWVEERVGGRLRQLKQGIELGGWRFVAIVRLTPILPFNVLNYAIGLTRIKPLTFIWASTVFMLPGTLAYTYLGSLGESILTDGSYEIMQKAAITISLFILLSCLPWIVRHIKK